MKCQSRRSRRGIAGIVATVIMFAMLFTVGTSYFIFVDQQNSSYVSSLLAATNKVQSGIHESLTITSLLETDGDIGFEGTDTSSVTVNMTAVLVLSSTGTLLKCDGVGFPSGAGCSNTTPTLWSTVSAGSTSSSFDTGYVYTSGTTDTIKVLTARGNSYETTYPSPASSSTSSQSVTVNLDNLKWVQLIPQASSLVQHKYTSNCNAASCAVAYSSSVTAANILVAAASWPSTSPPSTVPSDTLHDVYTLGASSSVNVASVPALVQDRSTANCNAASCGLAFSSNVASGHTLVYAVGWTNNAAPSTPTDTLGDSFTLGASQSATYTPPTPALVQKNYNSNCSSSTCALAYSSSVTQGNTLVYALGWYGTSAYVPVTIDNCQQSAGASLAIDGSNTNDWSGSDSGSVSLTTSKSNDVIVVLATAEDKPHSKTPTVSSVTASGLTFSKRSGISEGAIDGTYGYTDEEVWYAIATNPLSAVSITVTFTDTSTLDDAAVVAFGVNGANTSSPWDPNSSLPATADGSSSGPPSVSGVSTTNPDDLILGFTGYGDSASGSVGVLSTATGYTAVNGIDEEGGSVDQAAVAEENLVYVTQSSTTVAFGSTITHSGPWWTMIADAIQRGSQTSCTTGLSVDNSADSQCTNATTCTVAITTYNTNDVLYLAISDTSGGRTVSSVSDGSGLTWTARGTETSNGNEDVFSYYAISAETQYADTISVTISSRATIDLEVLAISGANTGTPFDPNLDNYPAAAGSTGTATDTFTTTNANDIIIGAAVTASETVSAGASGYTSLLCCSTKYSGLEYKIVTATGSQTPSFTLSGSGSWVELGDAIQAAPATSTPTVFQQMIQWNPSTYSSYESSTLGNIRFCTTSSCATELYSWLESCTSSCTNTATLATAWVRLTSAISSGSTTTIYMVFEATSVNFDDVYWGEAPNLSSTYAQYDNGANVFNAYFNGNTATSSFSVLSGYTLAQSTGITYGTGTVNVLKLTGYGNDDALVFNTAMSNAATIVESNIENIEYPTDSGDAGLVNNAAAGSVTNGESTNTGYGSAYFNQDYTVSGTTTVDINAQGTASATWVYASMAYSGTSAEVYYSYVAPQLYSTANGYSAYASVNPLSGATNVYMGFIYSTSSNNLADQYYNWARARAYPPNDVMPWTSFGTFAPSTGTPSTPTDTLGDSFTLGVSNTIAESTLNYYSYIWYATAVSSGSDTITVTFSSTVTGSVSIYEITGYSPSGAQTSTGSSTGGSTSPAVTSFTPASNSFVIGNTETTSSTSAYTAGSGFTLVGTCSSVYGCSQYEKGLGSATTVPMSLGTSAGWVESAISFPVTPTVTYYSYIWYATAASSGADTISANFGATVQGSVSIYEVSNVWATGLLSSTGSSTSYQSSSSVTSITPISGSVVIGNTETTSNTFTAGSGFTLNGACSSSAGCSEYETGASAATTVPMTFSSTGPWAEAALSFAPITTNYYSYIWYATAATSGADTVTISFGSTTTASVSLYEITGYTTSGALSSTGSSATATTTPGVTAFTPATDSFIVGTTEDALSTNTYTASSGFTNAGTCSTVEGCSEYYAGGGGSATTVSSTLSTSSAWVEAAMAFSTPFNPQSGIQVGGYPTMGVPSGAQVVWEVTFTNVDPQERAITIWPQTELAIGSAEYDGFDTDYTQAHYYIIAGLNAGSTTVNAYSTNAFITLQYNVPTTLYFAATAALGATTQAFGTNVLTPFQAYFALTGVFSDGTLFGETIPYPYGIITEANAFTTPTAGAPGATVTVSCTTPCDFNDGYSGLVGWINSAGQMTTLTTFTMNSSGNIPSGVTFQVPNVTNGYYTIEVTDYVNTVFMTFQVT